jgi:hypothetical protein
VNRNCYGPERIHLFIKGVIPDNTPIPRGDLWQINSQEERDDCTAWFQLHGLDHIWDKHGLDNLKDLAERSFRMPVYLYGTQVDRWSEWWTEGTFNAPPEHKFLRFPIETLCSIYRTRYFTGSYALLIAFAMYLNRYDSIDFLGTDFWPEPKRPQYPDEHWAVSCIEYWIGRAEAQGIQVYADAKKTALKHDVWGGIYGYEAGGHI